MSRFSLSRPSIITFSAVLGFLLGLGLLFVMSEAIVLLPRDLMDSIVRIPSFFGTDLNFLLGYFACFALAGGMLGFAASRNQKRGREDKTHLHRSHPSASRHSFTLIELLIVIAVIAVLATVVILALNPAELLRQSRDANRVSDLANLNQALTLYNVDVVGGNMGSSSVVYVSVPDPAATSSAGTDCSGIGLASSSLPSGWAWHCAASSTYRKVNGTGWLPVDFTKVSAGSPLGNLPVDPTNTTSTGLYYAYVVQGDPWELTANVESQKYGAGGSHDVVSKDGGQYPDLYETGSDLSLDPVDYDPSLVGYWKFDEGSGSIAYDSSGHGNKGTLDGSPIWQSTSNCAIGTSCLSFNGAGTQNVNTASSTSLNIRTPITMMAWIQTASSSQQPIVVDQEGANADQFGFRIDNGSKLDYFFNGGAGWVSYQSNANIVTLNQWYQVAVTTDGTHVAFYVNGSQVGTAAQSVQPCHGSAPHAEIAYGAYASFAGLIDDVRIYNRVLSASEIQAIYNAEK